MSSYSIEDDDRPTLNDSALKASTHLISELWELQDKKEPDNPTLPSRKATALTEQTIGLLKAEARKVHREGIEEDIPDVKKNQGRTEQLNFGFPALRRVKFTEIVIFNGQEPNSPWDRTKRLTQKRRMRAI